MKRSSSRPSKAPVFEPSQLEEIARIFSALADVTRLSILQLLRTRSATVSEICEELGYRQANVSKQLGVLRQHGFVERERIGNTARYSVVKGPVDSLCDTVCDFLRRSAAERMRLFDRH